MNPPLNMNIRFQLSSLKINVIQRMRFLTVERIRACLYEWPRDIWSSYTRILNEVDEYSQKFASRAFAFLRFSCRPLYIEELADACSCDLEVDPPLHNRLTPFMIYEILGPLISIQPNLPADGSTIILRHHTVLLAHSSVGVFLESNMIAPNFRQERQAANLLISRICFVYLIYYNTAVLGQENYPLRPYAWYYWERHVLPETMKSTRVSSPLVRNQAILLFNVLRSLKEDQSRIRDLPIDDSTHAQAIQKVMHAIKATHAHEKLKDALGTPYFFGGYENFIELSESTRVGEGSSAPRSFDRNDPSSITLLEILPSLNIRSGCKARFIRTSLRSAPSYVVLAQIWSFKATKDQDAGQLQPQAESVRVKFPGPRTMTSLGNMVTLAYMSARCEERQGFIWTDIHCSGQSYSQHFTSPMSQIPSIYGKAKNVLLGVEQTATTEAAIGLLSMLADQNRGEFRCVKLNSHSPVRLNYDESARGALQELLEGSWWTRLWNVHKVVFANNFIFMPGCFACHFNNLVVLKDFSSIQVMLDHLGCQSGSSGDCNFSPSKLKARRKTKQYYESLQCCLCSRGWRTTKAVLETKAEYAAGLQPLFPVLWWRFREHELTLDRDRVRALSWFCTDNNKPPYDTFAPPNSYPQSCVILSRWYLKLFQNLDFLSLSCANSREISQSWPQDGVAPKWYSQTFGNRGPKNESSMSQPLLLGTFGGQRAADTYLAGGAGTTPYATIDDRTANLSILGRAWDSCGEIFPYDETATEEGCDLDLLCSRVVQAYMARNLNETQDSATTKFCRTILADQDFEGRRLKRSDLGLQDLGPPKPNAPPRFWGNALRKRLTGSIRRLQGSGPRTQDAEEDDILRRGAGILLRYLTGRMPAISKRGHLCLVPSDTVPTDLIVVCPGGAVPYVLRPVTIAGREIEATSDLTPVQLIGAW